MDNEELRKRAQQRVDAKLGFRKHLRTYIFINVLLAIINLLTSPQYLWFLWVVFGWGIAIAMQGWGVYGPRSDPTERELMIEEEIKKLSSEGDSSDR